MPYCTLFDSMLWRGETPTTFNPGPSSDLACNSLDTLQNILPILDGNTQGTRPLTYLSWKSSDLLSNWSQEHIFQGWVNTNLLRENGVHHIYNFSSVRWQKRKSILDEGMLNTRPLHHHLYRALTSCFTTDMAMPLANSDGDTEKTFISLDEHFSPTNFCIDPKEEARFDFCSVNPLHTDSVGIIRLARRIDLRLVSASGLFYLLSILDRSNIVSHSATLVSNIEYWRTSFQ